MAAGRRRLIWALIAIAMPVAALGQYQVRHDVVGAGGLTETTGSHSITATISQPIVSQTLGTSYRLDFGFWYQPSVPLTGVDDTAPPLRYWLDRNYPNPFNPVTTLRFCLEKRGRVEIVVYDLAGREVRTLLDAERAPGFHEVRLDAKGLASGIYICRMRSGGYVQTRKLALIK